MATNPISGMMLQALMAKIAGSGGGQPGPGSPGGPLAGAGGPGGSPSGSDGSTVASSSDSQGDQLSKELSVMRVADPKMMTDQLTSVKKQIVTLINHSAMSLPAVARGLSKTLQGIDAAMKAAGEAAQTMQTLPGGPDASTGVGGPPLGNSALPPGMGTNPGLTQPGMAT